MFVDHCGQKFVGNEGPAEVSFARVKSTTHKPVTDGHLRSFTPILRVYANGRRMGAVHPLPHE